MPQAQVHPVHQVGSTAYADPVIRHSSPASSESSRVHDETTPFEAEMEQEEFNQRMEQDIGLGQEQVTERERIANESPLVKFPTQYYDPSTYLFLERLNPHIVRNRS